MDYMFIIRGGKMYEGFSREERLIGKENLEKLNKSKVAVFGIGGVGSFVVEGLARAGIGKLLLVDNDTIDITNINRQIHANVNTFGRNKVDVMKERILSINPEVEVDVSTEFFMPGSKLLDNSLDYIVDAIDTVTGKIELVCKANELNIPIISAMGTGKQAEGTAGKDDGSPWFLTICSATRGEEKITRTMWECIRMDSPGVLFWLTAWAVTERERWRLNWR